MCGKELWKLDTGNTGDDDMLIGSYDEVLSDVLYYHEVDALPFGWSITKVDWEI